METEPAPSNDDLPLHRRSQNHSSHSSSHSNHSNESNININNNNNNNNSLDNNGHHQADPDLSSEDDDGDFGSADEIGSEDASAWIARASRSLCAAADSRAGGAADGIDIGAGVGGGGSGGGAGGGGGCVLGVGAGTDDGPSPPLQGEVNVTLWQFLLELLMSRQYSHVIQWTNREGEFQLLRAEEVARLWGMRKNKNHRMNYDKLSRALRYYYQKNIIKKVQGQKFVYRFVGLSETALQASRSLGVAAATASIASPSDGVSPKLEAVDEDLPVEATPSPVDEPQLATQLAQPIQLQQQHAPPPPPPPPPLQQRTQSLTPPPLQPAAFAHATRRLWQCGQLLQHHQQHHHQQQQQGLDLSLPHSTSALAAASSVPAASSSPPPHSKRLRSPESGSSVRSPADSPPAAKRPCCACRCHEPQSRQSPPVAAVSTPRVKAEPTTAPILSLEAGDLMPDSGAGGLGALPGSYIQWLTLELAGSGAGGPGGPGGVGGGAGGSAYLHSSRHAANMKKLAEHIRLQKMMKRPEPAAPSSSASPVTSAASAHSLRHPHPPSAPAPAPLPSPVAGSGGLAGASALGNGSQTPFSPPGCVWMPVPVAMLSQLWAGHEAAAAAVAAASAAAAAAAAAASGAPPASSANSTLHGNLEDHGD